MLKISGNPMITLQYRCETGEVISLPLAYRTLGHAFPDNRSTGAGSRVKKGRKHAWPEISTRPLESWRLRAVNALAARSPRVRRGGRCLAF